ncbi:hypothetical protein ACQPXS_32750 [Streptomyces sp. CA-142005]
MTGETNRNPLKAAGWWASGEADTDDVLADALEQRGILMRALDDAVTN